MNLSSHSGRAKAALCGSLLIFIALGCDEDGKTTPEICASPPLEIYDIQDPPAGGAGEENPCVTKVGHAVSPNGGTDVGGSTGRAGSSASNAGGAGADAGGPPDMAGAGGG
jgi:hypothetical protein